MASLDDFIEEKSEEDVVEILAQLETPEYKRYVQIGWQIIEYKVAYYMPERVAETKRERYTISDALYDELEIEYLTLCKKLGKPNTLVHKTYPGFEDVDHSKAMMEIDIERPSVQLVLEKLGSE